MSGLQVDQTLTDKMVERAIGECARLYFAGDQRRLRQVLLRGECQPCKYVSDCLAHQIADYLGQVDQTIKSIYHFQPANFSQTAQDQELSSAREHTGINLIAWVDRKSAALSVLIGTLEAELSASQKKVGCVKASPGCYTLDVEIVDDQDLDEQRGFGLLINGTGLRSEPVWTRLVESVTSLSPATPQEDLRVKYALPDSFDPELIPESRLIEHGQAIENMPPEHRTVLEPHLLELKVTLIRRMISDQLSYIDIAKRWFTIADLAEIYRHRIGFGRIGGKSAGMLVAASILDQVADEDIRACLSVPDSYFLGSDLIYIFMAMNGLMYWNEQKYKPEERIWAEYPRIKEEFRSGTLPPEVLHELREIVEKLGNKPLIVRSSSQLEDNFGTTFAGKYDSYFCPNQGSPEENIKALTSAIALTYASTLKPEALLYRRSKGLEDYDERMAVLIQAVQGERSGDYYLPQASGVAFSRNLYRWSPHIRREDGFARLVWGLGTRAVQRVGDDYPRLVALSHPTLLPDDSFEAIRHYSQQYVDLIDMKANEIRTLPISQVITPSYSALRLIAQLEQDGLFTTPRMRVSTADIPKLAITYHEFLRRTPFASILSRMLRLLEKHFHSSVDVEFTVSMPDPNALDPTLQISLLQCRPQSYLKEVRPAAALEEIPGENAIFSTRFMVPQGYLKNIRYVLFVEPDAYFQLATVSERNRIGQVISRLNAILGEKSYICVGPGRWGSTNSDLGVYVSYADIHNAGALVELSGKNIGPAPEPSLGTHFFQDLMEAQIYPLAIFLDDESSRFNREFFYQSSNRIQDYLDVDEPFVDCIRLIDVNTYRAGGHLEIIMDDEKGEAIAFLKGPA